LIIYENDKLAIWHHPQGLIIMFLFIFLFRCVLSIDEYASFFENIDPLAPYKKWTTNLAAKPNSTFSESFPRNDVFSKRVQAAFVVSDPVDWSRDIQVTEICWVIHMNCLSFIFATYLVMYIQVTKILWLVYMNPTVRKSNSVIKRLILYTMKS